jgi:hypothetical protein
MPFQVNLAHNACRRPGKSCKYNEMRPCERTPPIVVNQAWRAAGRTGNFHSGRMKWQV